MNTNNEYKPSLPIRPVDLKDPHTKTKVFIKFKRSSKNTSQAFPGAEKLSYSSINIGS